jgi:hypothetical protein
MAVALVCAACEEQRPAAVPDTSMQPAEPAQAAAPAATEPTVPAASGSALRAVPVSNAEHVILTQIHPYAKRCYAEGLRSDPTMEGHIVIRLRVAADGQVASAEPVMNEGLSPAVAACVAAVSLHARFEPSGPGGATISVPFRFKRASPGSVPPPVATQNL